MKIQSLSIVVPNPNCINHCKFCVSCMHDGAEYKNQMDDNLPFFDLYMADYLKRLEFARDNGCNTVMLTGDSEPQQNRKFLTYFGMFMKLMRNPFHWIEMQTTGALLDANYLRFLRNHVGVNIISLSVSSFNDAMNNMIIGTPDGAKIHLEQLCEEIKRYDFSLRLSLNLTSEFLQYRDKREELFTKCKELGADQVTLRVLYCSGTGTKQDDWIVANAMPHDAVADIIQYVKGYGRTRGCLPHGAMKYSIDGLCVVIDEDCMDTREHTSEDYKYLILRPDCKLYSKWDDKSSLIF